MSIDYSELNEITVKSQNELDAIPLDFKGIIYIQFGTYYTPAFVRNKYHRTVVARRNSSVVAWENSSVAAFGNSSVEARENSSVVAWENSSVVARGNSSVEARGNSSVVAMENSSVAAFGNSSVVARENSSVEARENSSVVAWGNSSVVAMENSSVVAWENSSVVADGNTQIVDRLRGGKIEITGNARIVYMPKTIDEYCSFYGIKRTKKKGKFFKAVRKSDTGEYFSDKDWDFLYVIGKKAKADFLTEDTREDCGHGIHIAHLNWCLDYGKNWNNLAILEVEAYLDKIIVPDGCIGKVRCLEVKVLREVPLEECGIYGKMIANRLNKEREKDA